MLLSFLESGSDHLFVDPLKDDYRFGDAAPVFSGTFSQLYVLSLRNLLLECEHVLLSLLFGFLLSLFVLLVIFGGKQLSFEACWVFSPIVFGQREILHELSLGIVVTGKLLLDVVVDFFLLLFSAF